MKVLLTILLVVLGMVVKGQTPLPANTIPTQFSTGYFKQGWHKSDSGSISAVRDTNFLPRYAGTRILWQNAGVDTLEWYWTGAKWFKIPRSGGGSGTINTGNQYQLGYYAANGTTISPLTLITGNRAIVSNANGLPVAATTTATEIGYVNGVTSAIQTQLNNTWKLTGNLGTVDVTNFIGTRDDIPLSFKVNNFQSGRIDNTNANTFFGYRSGGSISSANNTSIGYASMLPNSSGGGNTSVGSQSLFSNTFGNNNTVVGYNGLSNNTSGVSNTVLGYNTGLGITIGSYNTILGANVMGLGATLSNNIIIADGQGNKRFTVDDVGTSVLVSTTALGLPTGNTAQRPVSPATGYLRYNTDSAAKETYNGTIWVKDGSGGGGSGITQLTGDVAATGSGSVVATIQANAVTTTKINNSAVTLGKLANGTANSLLGYNGSGVPSVITAGTNITIAGNIISATGGGSGDTAIWYDITHFGAIGDGVTDNTTAINAAITAATFSRGVVWMPAGTYLIRSSYIDTAVAYTPEGIILSNGITLLGAGIGKTIIILADPPTGATFAPVSAPLMYTSNTKFFNMITGTNVSNVTLRGFSINGKLANQINYDPNPYISPQDSTFTANTETDGIKFIGGNNNVIDQVRIDSIAAYGISNFGSTNNIYSNLVVTTAIQGGVYYSRRAWGSTLSQSWITNTYSDNVRIRSSNISVTNNEISFSKFNPNIGQANFAAVYVECFAGSNIAPPDIVGVRITNNYLHDNSSFGVDCNRLDTVLFTYSGYSVLIAENTIAYNANGGVQMHMPNMEIRSNQIFNNGKTQAGLSDPSNPTLAAINPHPSAFGSIVTGNSMKDTSGTQLYGLGGVAADIPDLFTFTNNTMQGGVSLIRNTPLTTRTIFGNTFYVTGQKIMSDIATNESGSLVFNSNNHSISIGDSSNTSYVVMTHQNNGESYVLGQSAGVNELAVGFDNKGLFKVASAGTSAGREIRFFDQVTVTNLGGVNSDGDFVWGTTSTNYTLRAHKYNADLSVNSDAVEINGYGIGSTNNQLQGALHTTLNAGYTGSGYPYAALFDNLTITTGNNLGGLGVGKASYGVLSRTTGAASEGANVSLYGFSSNALRNAGVVGDATVSQNNTASALSIGVIGYGLRVNSSATHIGGYFGLQSGEPTFTNAALIADNGTQTDPIFRARDNGTDVLRIGDGGSVYMIGQNTGTASMKIVMKGNDSLLYTIPGSTFATPQQISDSLNANTFEIDNPNLGDTLFVPLTATSARIKALIAGTNITFGVNDSTITINSSGGSTSPAGSNTQVQYNNSGAFGAEADFSYDPTTNILNIGNSTSSSNGTIVVGGSGTGTGNVTGGGGALNIVGGDLTLASNPTHRISIKTNTVERIGIENGGDVTITSRLGIGVAPLSPLHVEGATSATASGTFVNTDALGATSGAIGNFSVKLLPTAADQRLGFVGFGTRDGANVENITAGIAAFSTAAFTSGSSEQTNLRFYISTTNAPAEVMRITANQRVGIRTTNPQAALQLPAGAAAAGGAPLMLTAGTNLTSAVAGAEEYDGTSRNFSPSTTRLRYVLTDNTIPANGQLAIGNGVNYTNALPTAGTSGTDFAVATGAGTLTFNLPVATTTAQGKVSISAQTFGGQKTFNDGIIVQGSSITNSARIRVTGNNSPFPLATITAPNISVDGMTHTDGTTAGSGTITNNVGFNYLGVPVLAATNTLITYTDVSNLKIEEATAGTNITITRPRSIYAKGIGTVEMLANNIIEDNNTTLSLGKSGHYIFTGTICTTTLPLLASYKGGIYFIKNAGSGVLTITASGSDTIYDVASVTSITIAAGTARIFVAGTSWWVQ